MVGLLVQSVIVPGPAASAGLQEGDLIVAANGRETRSIENLCEQLLAARGEAIKLEVLRGTAYRSVWLAATNIDE
jgi:S1-C subfamily serine protease